MNHPHRQPAAILQSVRAPENKYLKAALIAFMVAVMIGLGALYVRAF